MSQDISNNSTHQETSDLIAGAHPGPKMPAKLLRTRPHNPDRMPWRLLVHISGDSHTTVGLEVKDIILIGRGDPATNLEPDLDLNDYGGAGMGVSRRHAQFVLFEQALYVEDLDSTNGTRLNGFSLEANHGYRLRDGDELEFGKIKIMLRFIQTPTTTA